MIVRDAVENNSHRSGVSTSSQHHNGWSCEPQMGELTVIGDVNTDGGHGAWESLIRVTEDFGDMSFIKVR